MTRCLKIGIRISLWDYRLKYIIIYINIVITDYAFKRVTFFSKKKKIFSLRTEPRLLQLKEYVHAQPHTVSISECCISIYPSFM